jgi:hypothetical protein
MKRAIPWCFGGALTTATSFLGARAFAVSNDPDPIELSITNCPDVTFEELRRLLAVELAGRSGGAPFQGPGEAVRGPDRIVVACWNPDSGLVANVSLLYRATGQTASKPIDLAHVPSTHRPRFLAIAIAELMHEPKETPLLIANADHSEAATHSTAPPSVDVPSSGAPAPAATGMVDTETSRGARSRWRFDMAAIALRSSGLDPFLEGGMGRASRKFSDWLAAEVDVASAGSSVPVSLGRAEILLVSAGASALAGIALGPLAWESGIGLRAGFARLSGTPANALSHSVQSRTVLEPWGGPFLTTRLAAEAGRHISFLLGLEGGYAWGSVVGRVDGATEVAITHFWTGLSLGLGWSP